MDEFTVFIKVKIDNLKEFSKLSFEFAGLKHFKKTTSRRNYI